MSNLSLALFGLEDPTGTLLAGAQILLLFVTAIGWGRWIQRLAGGTLHTNGADHVFCAIAGWAACILLLQNLVYLGVRIAFSGWIALAIAAAGWADLIFRRQVGGSSLEKAKFPVVMTVGLLAILFQGAGLWKHGAHNYYGSGHQDHVNYVQLGQFLIDKPFGMSLGEVGLEPWTVKAIDTKDMRIGQSVANAYAAVTSMSDAKSAYGAVSIFSIGLMAAAVFALLRLLGLPALFAGLGGLWSGVLPIVTHTHVDGFFSQTFVLSLLPALVGSTLLAGRHPRLAWLIGALLLSFLLTSYTEIFVVGVALVVVGHLTNSQASWLGRIVPALSLPLLAFLAVPAFISRFTAFIANQYKVAANANALADLAPRSGTWGGWSELFFTGRPDAVSQVVIWGGFLVLGLILLGIVSSHPLRRTRLALFAAIPFGLLALLLSMPVFSKYPFAKLLASFSPLFIAYASLGLARAPASILMPLSPLSGNLRGLVRHPAAHLLWAAVPLALLVCSAWGSRRELETIVRNEGIVSLLNAEQSRQIYQQLEAHPGNIYLLNEPHSILAAWFAYHARHSQVYVDADLLGDRPVPSSAFAFRRPPDNLELHRLNRYGIKSPSLVLALPDMLVRNSQGIEGDQNLTFYWIGDQATVEFHLFGHQPAKFVFSLRCLAGLANPDPHRIVSLEATQPNGEIQKQSFENDARLSFPVHLMPGRNVYTFRVLEPTEWKVKIPTDARKHMVRIQELSLTAP